MTSGEPGASGGSPPSGLGRPDRRLLLLAATMALASACSRDGDGGSGDGDGNAAAPAAGSPAARTRTRPPVVKSPASPSPSAAHALPRLPAEVAHGPRERMMVALTFHGSGSPELAEAALRAIEKAGGHATVLAVGTWLDQYPAMARRVLAGGHDLGNHTQHHLDISSLDEASARREIEECAARLRALTGSIGSWFRPSAARTATPLVRRLSARAGYPTCLSYDVDSLDHTDPGPGAVVDNVLRAVRPGSVVSMHLGHQGTVTALPRVLDGLRARGLRAVTTTELLRA
ncbi:polysaccharide deacetylase family protein [Microtetraspora fusca]|uniref:polysaccharide deacetylase family protein n=1 Tax=Microtetraspora fusca TaxID=1997 RepID=UPI000A007F9C|nr:polysaccharide deacetylase family protein [Microtetraspora fusca]